MQESQFSLKGKTILLTGATSGIGKECAGIFAKLGANLVLSGRSESKLKTVSKELGLENRHSICADLSDENSLSLPIHRAHDNPKKLAVIQPISRMRDAGNGDGVH